MGYEWQFYDPQSEGIEYNILNQLDSYIKQKRYRLINSVLVIKNGRIAFERYYNRYHENSRNNIKSIWKSILAITAGICLDKGIIKSFDEPVASYLPEFGKEKHPLHKLITIRHLLTMSSGIYWNGGIHYHCPMLNQMKRTDNWTEYISDIAVSNIPGTKFFYKEWDVMLLSAVIGKACGRTAFEATREYLYEPLDITSGEWSQSPCGFSYTILRDEENSDLSARDLAKIGLLFINNGIFDGKKIISQEFIKSAVNPSFDRVSFGAVPGNMTYGYLWWLFPDGYGCRGYGGQEINVIPEKGFISVIQATATPSSKSYEDINENILKKAIK